MVIGLLAPFTPLLLKPAKSLKGLCRVANLCGVSHGQMAKVELEVEFCELRRDGVFGSAQGVGGSLRSRLPPKIHRRFIGASYSIGGVGLYLL
jgi:hypothetical protein